MLPATPGEEYCPHSGGRPTYFLTVVNKQGRVDVVIANGIVGKSIEQ